MPRRKQFGPRKLHQSARGADGLKAVTFPAGVTGSYFTHSRLTDALLVLPVPPRPASLIYVYPATPATALLVVLSALGRRTASATKPADENATLMVEVKEGEEEEEEDAPISSADV